MNPKRRLPEVWRRVGILLVVVSMTVFVGSVAAYSQVRDTASGPRISLDVIDADLRVVVMQLTRDSRQSIIIAAQDKAHAKVTATIKDMPLDLALKRIVESVGLSCRREPDGTYIIGGEPASPPAPAGQAMPLAESLGPAGWMAATEPPARRESKVEVIPLYHVRPADMMWLLGLYGPDDAVRIEHTGIAPAIRNPSPWGALPPPPTVDATPPLMESLRGMTGVVAERAPGPWDEAAQIRQPPSPPGTTTRPGQVGAPTTPGAPGTGQQAGLWPEGIEYIMPYELDNSLIVKGTDIGIEDLEAIIKQLDLPPKQVSIKAEFVEISTTEASSLGVDWSLERMNSVFETQFGPGGNVVFGYANGNVMATLRTKLLQNKAKLINAPIISTLNNVMAAIQVGRVIPYWITILNPTGTGGQGYITQTVPQFLNISSELLVRPTINRGDNSITVWMQPRVADAGDPVKGPDGTEIPAQNQQSLTTTRRVPNGETIVVGGIIRKSDSTNVTKIPLLGDLPIIGPLFRNTSKNTTDTELLIFITPTIVPERPVAGTEIGVQGTRPSVRP